MDLESPLLQNILYILHSRKTLLSTLLHLPESPSHHTDEMALGTPAQFYQAVPLLQMESYSWLLSPHCFALFQFILLKDHLQKHYNRKPENCQPKILRSYYDSRLKRPPLARNGAVTLSFLLPSEQI